MTESEMTIGEAILQRLSYDPNPQQMELVAAFTKFVLSSCERSAFLLNGYAGTGKTSLTSALVNALTAWGVPCVLLAPTGRAAKVFSLYSKHNAYTIHRKIYRSNRFNPETARFSLDNNSHKGTLFIVDEASMIPNHNSEGAVFGTGRLLDDLITYVYNGHGCRLILLGDVAQLPPVGYSDSPALSADVLRSYGLTVYSYTLTAVARQKQASGILANATRVRDIIASGHLEPPVIAVRQYLDMEIVSGEFLAERIADCYAVNGCEETIVVTRSNKRANMFNQGIRSRVLYMETELAAGDMLLVVKNNYHWVRDFKDFDFIANGDVAVVRHLGRTTELYGFRFADVTLEFPDYNVEIDTKIILDTLYADTPALSRDQSNALYMRIMADYTDLPLKRDKLKRLKEDPFYNALQVKFAYSVTCHKAQGGQWKNVFIDMGYIPEEAFHNLDFYRWLYTSLTRAYGKIFLINPPLTCD